MVDWFHLQPQRTFERRAAKQVKPSAGYKPQLGDVMKLFQVMRAHTADYAIGARWHLDERHIHYMGHHAIFAGNRLSVWAARGMTGELIHAVLDLIVNAALEDVGKLMGGAPVIVHHFDEKHLCQTVAAQRGHGDFLAC